MFRRGLVFCLGVVSALVLFGLGFSLAKASACAIVDLKKAI
jgi:hypothetical protein